jgi:hypothetical protein
MKNKCFKFAIVLLVAVIAFPFLDSLSQKGWIFDQHKLNKIAKDVLARNLTSSELIIKEVVKELQQ